MCFVMGMLGLVKSTCKRVFLANLASFIDVKFHFCVQVSPEEAGEFHDCNGTL